MSKFGYEDAAVFAEQLQMKTKQSLIRKYTLINGHISEGISIDIQSKIAHSWNTVMLDLLNLDAENNAPSFSFVYAPGSDGFTWDDTYMPNKNISEETKTLIKRLYIDSCVLALPVPSRAKMYFGHKPINTPLDSHKLSIIDKEIILFSDGESLSVL